MNEIAHLLKIELASINNPDIRKRIEAMLVPLTAHERNWDYSISNEKFTCWTIAVEPAYDLSFVYCDKGFGPETPWGMVGSSTDYFGMDSAWYESLENCFLESPCYPLD